MGAPDGFFFAAYSVVQVSATPVGIGGLEMGQGMRVCQSK
jgi:hypothetical protein